VQLEGALDVRICDNFILRARFTTIQQAFTELISIFNPLWFRRRALLHAAAFQALVEMYIYDLDHELDWSVPRALVLRQLRMSLLACWISFVAQQFQSTTFRCMQQARGLDFWYRNVVISGAA
jgi:hypothetical protein